MRILKFVSTPVKLEFCFQLANFIVNGSNNERVEKWSACRDKNPGKLEPNYRTEEPFFYSIRGQSNS